MYSFSNFESQVNKKILDRGFDYYEYDHVSDVDFIDTGEFSATVEGTETYDVFVKIVDDYIVEHTCTCPYYEEWDTMCKHIVAVLYYIKDNEMLEDEFMTSTADDVKELLAETSDAELREFIFNYAKRNRTFREEFFKHLG